MRSLPDLRRQPARLGAERRQARRGRRLPLGRRRARPAGLHPHALPRQPRLPHPRHLRASPSPSSPTTSRRAAEIGAEGVVVHTGSYVEPAGAGGDGGDAGERHAAALGQVREGLLPLLEALDATPDSPWLLLEPTAGQGRSLCAGVEDLEPYLAALDFHPKAGICLDTCHVFAAGAPLDEPGGATATVDRIVEIGGPGRLRLIHANDSMDVRGAFKDRHQKIGDGHIGVDAFAELFAHPATDGVPFILETPGSRSVGDPDLALLKSLR